MSDDAATAATAVTAVAGSVGTVTAGWIAAAPYLPPLTDPAAQTAEKLMLLLHYGIDWSESNWLAARRGDYWDTLLPSCIQVATYRSGANLHRWWSAVSASLGSAPRTGSERLEVATLLADDHRKAVLQASSAARTSAAGKVGDSSGFGAVVGR